MLVSSFSHHESYPVRILHGKYLNLVSDHFVFIFLALRDFHLLVYMYSKGTIFCQAVYSLYLRFKLTCSNSDLFGDCVTYFL